MGLISSAQTNHRKVYIPETTCVSVQDVTVNNGFSIALEVTEVELTIAGGVDMVWQLRDRHFKP